MEANGRLIGELPAQDKILNVDLALQLDEKVVAGRVKRQSLGLEGKIVGRYDDNPIMKSMIYEVELPESQVKDYAENVIARNMLSQVYDKGYSATLVDSIVYYKRDNSAVENSDKYVVTRRGQLRLRKTIQGWKVLDAWRDGSETYHLKCNVKCDG